MVHFLPNWALDCWPTEQTFISHCVECVFRTLDCRSTYGRDGCLRLVDVAGEYVDLDRRCNLHCSDWTARRGYRNRWIDVAAERHSRRYSRDLRAISTTKKSFGRSVNRRSNIAHDWITPSGGLACEHDQGGVQEAGKNSVHDTHDTECNPRESHIPGLTLD